MYKDHGSYLYFYILALSTVDSFDIEALLELSLDELAI